MFQESPAVNVLGSHFTSLFLKFKLIAMDLNVELNKEIDMLETIYLERDINYRACSLHSPLLSLPNYTIEPCSSPRQLIGCPTTSSVCPTDFLSPCCSFENIKDGVMAHESIWLGHWVPKHLAQHYSRRVHEGVSE